MTCTHFHQKSPSGTEVRGGRVGCHEKCGNRGFNVLVFNCRVIKVGAQDVINKEDCKINVVDNTMGHKNTDRIRRTDHCDMNRCENSV